MEFNQTFIKKDVKLNAISKYTFEKMKEKGFWDEKRNIGEMLMLITSELGEAIEAHRKGRNSYLIHYENHRKQIDEEYLNTEEIKQEEYLGNRTFLFEETIKDTFEDEIADTFIRLFDLCGGLGIDIERHIFLKMEYNATRKKKHGKLY